MKKARNALLLAATLILSACTVESDHPIEVSAVQNENAESALASNTAKTNSGIAESLLLGTDEPVSFYEFADETEKVTFLIDAHANRDGFEAADIPGAKIILPEYDIYWHQTQMMLAQEETVIASYRFEDLVARKDDQEGTGLIKFVFSYNYDKWFYRTPNGIYMGFIGLGEADFVSGFVFRFDIASQTVEFITDYPMADTFEKIQIESDYIYILTCNGTTQGSYLAAIELETGKEVLRREIKEEYVVFEDGKILWYPEGYDYENNIPRGEAETVAIAGL